MNNNNKPLSKGRTKNKFNVKDIDSLTIKQVNDLYREAVAFIKACNEKFNAILDKDLIGITRTTTHKQNIDYDAPVLGGGSVVDLSSTSFYPSGMENYTPQDIYVPPINIDPLEKSYESNMNVEVKNDETDAEINRLIQEEVVQMFLKQQSN